MKKSTIVDVARACGLSIKTVSRVINQSPNVREETKERVYAAIKEQGYQVNMLARGLKGSRTDIIVVFVDRHNEEHLSIWHTLMLKYLFLHAKKLGKKIVLSPSNSNRFVEDETDGFYLIANGVADGAILLENVLQDTRIRYFQEENIPYVLFGESEEEDISTVSLDNFDVGRRGGRYLLEKGYRHIALFVGEEKYVSSRRRIAGFRDVMEESGTKYTICSGLDTMDKVYQEAKKLLHSSDIEAFFVSGDERALGVYKAVYEKGMRIPEDIGILGIDNIPQGEFYYPPISTMEQDFSKLALCCLESVIEDIEDIVEKGENPPKKTIRIPSRVISRGSG